MENLKNDVWSLCSYRVPYIGVKDSGYSGNKKGRQIESYCLPVNWDVAVDWVCLCALGLLRFCRIDSVGCRDLLEVAEVTKSAPALFSVPLQGHFAYRRVLTLYGPHSE